MNVSSLSKVFGTALAAVVALGVSLSAAAGGGPDCQNRMSRMDVEGNGDGMISAADHANAAGKRFEMMDADRDGRITGAEIDASHGAESFAWAGRNLSSADKIRMFDADRDGALDLTEYAKGSQKMFSKLDVDGDGRLTAAEMRPDRKLTALDAD